MREEGSGGGYRWGDVLGTGSAAVVHEATDSRDGTSWALKSSREASLAASMRLRREARLLAEVAGPGWVGLREVIATPSGPGLVLERLQRRSPAARSWDAIRAEVAALSQALARLHVTGWVHGDVSARNVLWRSDGRPALVDLGNAVHTGQPARSRAGTPGFAAPEVAAGLGLDASTDRFGLAAWWAWRWSGDLTAAPPADRALIDAMRCPEREGRPSGREVAAALGFTTEAAVPPVSGWLGASPRNLAWVDEQVADWRRAGWIVRRAAVPRPPDGWRSLSDVDAWRAGAARTAVAAWRQGEHRIVVILSAPASDAAFVRAVSAEAASRGVVLVVVGDVEAVGLNAIRATVSADAPGSAVLDLLAHAGGALPIEALAAVDAGEVAALVQGGRLTELSGGWLGLVGRLEAPAPSPHVSEVLANLTGGDARSHYARAHLSEALGDRRAAGAAYARCAELDLGSLGRSAAEGALRLSAPLPAPVMRAVARSHVAAGNHEEAAAWIGLLGADPEARLLAAEIEHVRTGDGAALAARLERSRRDPSAPEHVRALAAYLLGRFHASAGRPDLADDALREAQRRFSGIGEEDWALDAAIGRSFVLLVRGAVGEACDALEHGLEHADPGRRGRALDQLATASFQACLGERALELRALAVSCFREAGDLHNAAASQVALCHDATRLRAPAPVDEETLAFVVRQELPALQTYLRIARAERTRAEGEAELAWDLARRSGRPRFLLAAGLVRAESLATTDPVASLDVLRQALSHAPMGSPALTLGWEARARAALVAESVGEAHLAGLWRAEARAMAREHLTTGSAWARQRVTAETFWTFPRSICPLSAVLTFDEVRRAW